MMNIKDVKQTIVDLNDGENIEYETSFVSAANLALAHIARVIPDDRIAIIRQTPPILGVIGKNEQSYNVASAATLSFKGVGIGALHANGSIIASWNSPGRYTNIRVRLGEPTDLELEFVGGETRDLWVWDVDFGNKENIPMGGEQVEYDMRRVVDDYGGYAGYPVYGKSRLGIYGSYVASPYIYLPASFTGSALVTYRHKPRLINLEDVTNNIDFDIKPELEDLLPLLMSYYIWLEDEPGKAAAFLSRFNEGAAIARSDINRVSTENIISSTGW